MRKSSLWPYSTTGEAHTTPVVYLHGFMGSGEDWLPTAQKFSRKIYSIYPDLPGHAKNIVREVEQPLSFELLAKELNELLDDLELSSINLVGYSMGGRLGLYFALHYPERINKLVLESASPGIRNAEERMCRKKVDEQRAAEILENGMDTFVDEWYRMPLFDSLAKLPKMLNAIKLSRKQNNSTWMAKIIRELSPGVQPHMWTRLHQLTMPVLLIAGQLDNNYVAIIQEMHNAIKTSQVVTISASGHNCHLEQNEQFSNQLDKFFMAENS